MSRRGFSFSQGNLLAAGRLRPGERVYIDLTPEGLRPLNAGDKCVHIYENRLALPREFDIEEVVLLPSMHDVVEDLRWGADKYDFTRQALMTHRPPRGCAAFTSLNPRLKEASQDISFVEAFFRPANVLGTLRPRDGKIVKISQTSQPSHP